MFGRSDKLYIKQFQQETNVTVYILLDVSKNMSFAGDGSVSKIDYGSFLAAALSYMMPGQSDSIGLALFAEQVKHLIPPHSRRTHLNAILTALQGTKPAGQTRFPAVPFSKATAWSRLLQPSGKLYRKQENF